MTLAHRDPRLGDVSQIASARQVRLVDGSEDGVRAIDVRVAGGIHALVLADRGLDLGPAWIAGHPLAWQSPTGAVHPAYFRDDAWLRSFHGGLMFTAGLQNVGSANLDGAEQLGLHGRISNLPARGVTAGPVRDERGLSVVVRGEVRETTVYGADLILHRTLRFPVGRPVIQLHDEVVNIGYETAPAMILYHLNLGYPVVDKGSRFISPATDVTGWDDVSRANEHEHASFAAPRPGFPVQVFEHLIPDTAPDRITVGIVNEHHLEGTGIGFAVSYRRSQLSRLWQWRMLGEGLYVTGIEPANCGLLGRAVERERGTLPELASGASMAFDLELRAAVGPDIAGLWEDPPAEDDPALKDPSAAADAGAATR